MHDWSWSHSQSDYRQMFDLTDDDLTLKIFDCAAGLASFNSEMNTRNVSLISCDPLYALDAEALTLRAHQLQTELFKHIETNPAHFNWTTIADMAALKHRQQANAHQFLHDFAEGHAKGRYISGTLPKLPFKDYQFDLSLCANFIFDGVPNASLDFILGSVRELCRIGREVRIFPLLDSNGAVSPQLGAVMAALQAEDYGVEVRQVRYDFLKHGNAMLRIWPNQCWI